MSQLDYALGHSATELHRLEVQSAMFAPATERMLRAAGLAPGMSVLDIGTGAGDVAMMAARLVGAEGSVTSIDREEGALERARLRANAGGAAARVTFHAASLETFPPAQDYDFVVGRFVLSWQADQPAFLVSAARHAKRDGTMLFIEPGFLDFYENIDGRRWSNPTVPLYDEAAHRLIQTCARAGYRMETGANFVGLFHDAGLGEPTITLEQSVGGPNSLLIEHLCLTLQSLMSAAEREAASMDFSTLHARLTSAAAATNSQLWSTNIVAGWTRIA